MRIVWKGWVYPDKIKDILNNYDKYKLVKGRRLCGLGVRWVEELVKEIGKRLFDEKVYGELYNLKMDKDMLVQYWINVGCREKHVCFDFVVPDNFDVDLYIRKNGIKKNVKYAYLHWWNAGRSDVYLKKGEVKNLVVKRKDFGDIEGGVVMEDYYNVCAILNKVIKCDTVKEGLLELNDYCERVPYIKINDILNRYIENVF